MSQRASTRVFRSVLTVTFTLLLFAGKAHGQTQDVIDQFESREHTLDGFTLPYRLFIPRGLDPSVQYPLILTLHGSGQRGSNNESHIADFNNATTWAQPEAQTQYPAFVVAPQAPTDGTWAVYSLDPDVIGVELATTMDLLDSLTSATLMKDM